MSLGLEAGLMQTLDTVGKLERPELAGTCTQIKMRMSGVERLWHPCTIVSNVCTRVWRNNSKSPCWLLRSAWLAFSLALKIQMAGSSETMGMMGMQKWTISSRLVEILPGCCARSSSLRRCLAVVMKRVSISGPPIDTCIVIPPQDSGSNPSQRVQSHG